MNREKQLIKNTVIITIGKICTQMVSFFLLPLYTAILSTEEYGIVDLLNTLVSLLIPIITLQIEQAVFRHLIDSRENQKNKIRIISTTIFTITVQSIIYLGIFLIFSRWINNEYKFFLATNVIACIFSSIMLQISRGLGDNKSYAIGSFLSAATTIIFNMLFIVVFQYGAYGMLMSSFLANIICAIYIFIKKRIYQYISLKEFKKEMLNKLWKYSFPLIPNALSWWIFNSSDRIIVSTVLGMGQNGILSAAHKFSTVYITIYNIFNMTWTESASIHIEDEDRDLFFSKITNTMTKLFSSICFLIIACMPFVFPIMINATYGEAYNQIPILMLASLANIGVGLVSVIYIAKKKTKEIAKISIMAAIINITINIALINFIGLYAASISTLVAYVSMLLYRMFDIKKYVKIKLEKNLILKILLIATFILITYYINNFILNLISLIIIVIFSIYTNKHEIHSILNIFKSKFIKGDLKDEK